MSHHTPVFSPEGTPLEQRSVGELVAERPNLSRVFQSYNIDFCCQGGRTVVEACERKSVALPEFLSALNAAMEEPAEPEKNPATLPISELVDYIVEKHHGFLRAELPRIYAMADRVAQVHGGHTPALVEVRNVFVEMANELVQHTKKEEEVLFPAIMELGRGGPAMPLDGPISRMMEEHDDAGEALKTLKQLTNGYQPPAEACNTYRALFAGLSDLDSDLKTHIHLENSVLFPAAKERQAAGA